MKIVENIFINCPPDTVWTFLIDPQNMLLWNPKVKRVSPSNFGTPGPAYRYAITYQMRDNTNASEFNAEFVEFHPPARLVINLTGTFAPHDRMIEEIYKLSEQGNGTFLTQTIHIDSSGINIFFRCLIWVIRRWGKPVGPRYLEGLRDIIETKQSGGSG